MWKANGDAEDKVIFLFKTVSPGVLVTCPSSRRTRTIIFHAPPLLTTTHPLRHSQEGNAEPACSVFHVSPSQPPLFPSLCVARR